jgi:hypothetical protein
LANNEALIIPDAELTAQMLKTADDKVVEITLPFQGGMDRVHQTTLIPNGGFSYVQNFRPRRPGFVQRKGCAKLNTTGDGSNGVLSLNQFSKGKKSEIHTYAQMSDGDVIEFTNNPPTVTTGVLGSSVYSTEDSSKLVPASWANINEQLVFCDGAGSPRIYSGLQSHISSCIVYKGSGTIPTIPLMGEDYSLQVRDGKSTTYAVLSNLSTIAAYDAVFVRTNTPADALSFIMSSVNTSGAVAQIHYWNGSWSAVSDFVDGTADGGATLSQAGTMTWTMTTDHIPHYMFGSSGYWLRISLASGVLDTEVLVSSVTYESDWGAAQNVWDGVPISALEAYLYTHSTTNYVFYSAQEIEVGGMTSSDKLYFNFPFKVSAIYYDISSTSNTVAAAMTLKYWNGSSFGALSGVADGTTNDSQTLAVPGWVTFTRPTDEQKTMFQSSQYYSYWYELTVNATITAGMTISIQGMPYNDINEFGDFQSCHAWKGRISYAVSELPGYICISGKNQPMVLNGDDYAIQEVGDGRTNKVVSQRNFKNELIVWQEERGRDGGCLTLIEGYSPETYGKLILSTRYGTFSSKSTCVCEDVPIWTMTSYKKDNLVSDPGTKTIAFFLSHYGFCATDGQEVIIASSGKIQNHFDQNIIGDCIRRGYESQMWVDYDSLCQVVRIGLVTGPSATVCNTFLVYDILTGEFYYDSLGYPLSAHCEVEASSGNSPILQIGGGAADGTIYQLNTGTADVATAIDSYATMEFDGKGKILRIQELILRATGTCTITPYEDGAAKTPITI